MSNHEKKLIRLSLATLFLSLLMIYILLYQVKGDKMEKKETTTQEPQWITITETSWTESTIIEPTTTQDITDITWAEESDLFKLETQWSAPKIASGGTTNKTGWETTWSSTTNIHMLSWTKLYYGKIDAIEKLGIKYLYALIDESWTFLINLWPQQYNFDNIARALNGDVYKITTEQELAKNKLFGEKVIYINIPEYKGKTVVMLEYIGKEIRLIQINYTLYHKSKSYLKSLFID